MTIGAANLLEKCGSRLGVAEAFILGSIEINEEEFVPELVDKVTLEAARIRLEAMGLLNKNHINPKYIVSVSP